MQEETRQQNPTRFSIRLGGWAGGERGVCAAPPPRFFRITTRRRGSGRRGRGELSKAPRGLREGKTLGTGGKNGPPRSPQNSSGWPLHAGTPLALPSQLPPNLDTPPPAAGRPQAAGKRRGPDTPKLSPRAPRTARPAAPRRSRSRRLAAARETRPLPSASHSTPLPAAALPLSPLTARRHFPRSSALNRKLAAQHSASSHCSRRRRHHKLSSRSRRRYCGGAEAVAAGAEARGPPGYVVSRPRPALPVPGGLARPGRWVVPPGQASVARGRGRVDPGAAFAHLPPGTRGGIRGTGVQP